jgi:hypothetical protein
MAKMKRLMVRGHAICGLDIYEFDGKLGEVCKRLASFGRKYARDWSNIQIEVDYNYDDTTVRLIGDREETDEEYNQRVKRRKRYLAERRAKQ